jgi:hypothetical protein
MLAHHPLTGKPIKILRTAPQISSANTLLAVSATMAPSPRYSRYSVAITDPAAFAVSDTVSIIVAVSGDWSTVLPAAVAKNPELLVFAKRSIAETLDYSRVLILEDMVDAYPWMGEPLTDSVEHVLLFIAHLLRFPYIIWPFAVERDALPLPARLLYDSWTRVLGGTLRATGPDDSFIPRTTLIQQYYEPPQGRRHREIKTCLANNVASPYIDRILLLNEKEYSDLPKSEKIVQQVLGSRMTYYDAFLAAQNSVAAGDFVIIANSDIWFDATISWLWRIPMKDQSLFLALLRWEEPTQIFGPRPDSQDTWIFARDSLTFPILKAELEYPFGQSGCDNAIALDMMRKKFLVVNPAYTIKTMHLHKSNVRTYDPANILYRPHYLHIDPTAIQMTRVVTNMDAVVCDAAIAKRWRSAHQCESFVRPILSTDPAVGGSQNRYTPTSSAPLYRIRGGAFVSASGLVSDWRQMYVGPHKAWASGWEGAKQTLLTQCVQVSSALALPCSTAALGSLSRWVLDYVPRVLAVYEVLSVDELPEFGAPSVPGIGEFLTASRWPGLEGKSVNVLPLLEDVQVYATDVWAVPLEGEGNITREDVARLRSLLPPVGVATEKTPCAVLCVGGEVLTSEWADSVREYILGKGWAFQTIVATDSFSSRRDALRAADWIIGSGEALDWIWCAKEGATVLEFLEGAGQSHLAAAASLRYIAAKFQGDLIADIRQNALLEVGKAIQQFGFKELLVAKGATIPFLTLPTGKALSGHYNHSGDTFREMARIWRDRGYCTIKESDATPHCWWGEAGEILLYDRPTLRWHDEKASYQMGLFGNCPPPNRLRDSTWSFWPRSPAAIEALVESGACLRTWEERTLPSLFLGKIENGVQLAARQAKDGPDWSKAVSLFSMPVDSTGAPYPYTQTQYLDLLCSARFGLCLPGFGKKCNREIEYFACGTVPIVTEGVDMTNYLVPPIAGVHYLSAKTPEDVRRIVATTTEEKWTAMSVAGRTWWRNYASAEGMFRLTWARIEQCRPYFTVGIPPVFTV